MKKITKTTTNYYDGEEKLINRTETIIEEDVINPYQNVNYQRPVIPPFIPRCGSGSVNCENPESYSAMNEVK